MVTRSCTQQQFLLRPDAEMNNAFVYCLAVSAQMFDVTVITFVQMSNHLHSVVFDRHGNLPEFNHYFHTLLAKFVNCLRDRRENVFSSDQVNVVRLEDTEALIRESTYVATNPLKHDLVATVDEWPGSSGHRALVSGVPLKATRPKRFFSAGSFLPAEVTLELRVPPELADPSVVIAEIAARVDQYERDAERIRAAAGKKVVGRYALLRRSWRDSPTSDRRRRGLIPTFAGRLWARVEAAQLNKKFLAAYRFALEAWRAGVSVPFPHGTYWMRRFASVAVLSEKTT